MLGMFKKQRKPLWLVWNKKGKEEGCYISGVQGPGDLEHHKGYGLYSNSKKKLLEGCEL